MCSPAFAAWHVKWAKTKDEKDASSKESKANEKGQRAFTRQVEGPEKKSGHFFGMIEVRPLSLHSARDVANLLPGHLRELPAPTARVTLPPRSGSHRATTSAGGSRHRGGEKVNRTCFAPLTTSPHVDDNAPLYLFLLLLLLTDHSSITSATHSPPQDGLFCAVRRKRETTTCGVEKPPQCSLIRDDDCPRVRRRRIAKICAICGVAHRFFAEGCFLFQGSSLRSDEQERIRRITEEERERERSKST